MMLAIEMKEKIFLTIKTYFKLNKMERNEMILKISVSQSTVRGPFMIRKQHSNDPKEMFLKT